MIVGHLRRKLIGVSVTTNPTAEWYAGQVTGASPWKRSATTSDRDRYRSFGQTHTHSIAMGIRDHPTAPARRGRTLTSGLIISIRREGLDHMLVVGEAELRPRPESLRLALKSGPHSSVLEQRRSASDAAKRLAKLRQSPSWRTPSSLCSCIEFSQGQRSARSRRATKRSRLRWRKNPSLVDTAGFVSKYLALQQFVEKYPDDGKIAWPIQRSPQRGG